MTTREEILAMAREAGFQLWVREDGTDVAIHPCVLGQNVTVEVGRLVRLAQAAAYERAAAICDGVNNHDNPMTARDCADAIRDLKDQT